LFKGGYSKSRSPRYDAGVVTNHKSHRLFWTFILTILHQFLGLVSARKWTELLYHWRWATPITIGDLKISIYSSKFERYKLLQSLREHEAILDNYIFTYSLDV